MDRFTARYWIKQGERRQVVLLNLSQPLTATQLSRKTRIARDAISYVLWELSLYQLVECCNPSYARNRVYRPTKLGLEIQNWLLKQWGLNKLSDHSFDVDCDLLGWVSFSHRSAIIKTLERPMQSATAKRAARARTPELRMSANNVRDALKLMEKKRVVRRKYISGKSHPHFELTDTGRELQQLLWKADTPGYDWTRSLREFQSTTAGAVA